jgi:chromosome segregation ATPase
MNMNNEEFDRKMAFIVEQQARFASDIQQLQESQARTEQMVAHTAGTVGVTAETVAQMADVVTRLANVTHAGFTELNAKINALVDAQIRTEENLARTEGNLARTQENLMLTDRNVAHTDESLKNLIAVVDRYLSGRNGK